MSGTGSNGPPILAGKDLHTYYGASHVLRGVSLAISEGETIGLMGRNGMGKTTLIRTLMGLVAPRRGQRLVDGRDANEWATYRIAQAGVAYVPEGRGIFGALTVAENLAIAERTTLSGERPWSRDRVLDLFPRLAHRLRHRGDQLSGGEQQMLAIGRALIANPRLIILDEATEGLAPLVRDEIWQTISLIRQAGIATLIVDKNVEAVTAMADRVTVIIKGETAFEGPPAALRSNPELMHRYLGV